MLEAREQVRCRVPLACYYPVFNKLKSTMFRFKKEMDDMPGGLAGCLPTPSFCLG